MTRVWGIVGGHPLTIRKFVDSKPATHFWLHLLAEVLNGQTHIKGVVVLVLNFSFFLNCLSQS